MTEAESPQELNGEQLRLIAGGSGSGMDPNG